MRKLNGVVLNIARFGSQVLPAITFYYLSGSTICFPVVIVYSNFQKSTLPTFCFALLILLHLTVYVCICVQHTSCICWYELYFHNTLNNIIFKACKMLPYLCLLQFLQKWLHLQWGNTDSPPPPLLLIWIHNNHSWATTMPTTIRWQLRDREETTPWFHLHVIWIFADLAVLCQTS